MPDDVLAAMACGTDALRENAGMAPGLVLGHTRDAHRGGCAKDLVAVGRHPDGLAFYCVRPQAGRRKETLVIDFDSQDGSTSQRSFVAWLSERVDSRREFLEEGDDEQRERARAVVTAEALEDFAPALITGEP